MKGLILCLSLVFFSENQSSADFKRNIPAASKASCSYFPPLQDLLKEPPKGFRQKMYMMKFLC